jgi:hypothetical protein
VDQLLRASDPARGSIVTSACVAASVAAVVAVLAVPGWLAAGVSGPSEPLPPVPTPREETIGTRSWTAQECPGGGSRCAVPAVLDVAGARFLHVGGHRQAVHQRDLPSRTLVTTVDAGSGRRWLLVGATGASSASALSVQLGSGESAVVRPGTLSFLSVPEGRQRVQVTLADYGRPSAGERLRIEEYDALGQ